MGSIDDFLEQLTDQHQEKKEKLNSRQSSSKSPNNLNQMNSNEDNIDAYISQLENKTKDNKSPTVTDDLLQDIESNYPAPKTKTSQVNHSKDVLAEIEQQFKQQTKTKEIISNPQDSSIVDNSIRQIVRHSENKIKTQQNAAENLADIKQEELNKQREVKQLTRKAEIWLKNLDPNSDEGFWFEQFAMSYESKQEAAMEYLKALGNN